MGAYTWTEAGFDYSGFVNAHFFSDVPLTIPAGSTLKRFLVRRVVLDGYSTSGDYRGNTPPSLYLDVKFTAGHYLNRYIYRTCRGIPFQQSSLFDVVLGNQYYTNYYWGGDNEFGINERCSYGKVGYPAMTLSLQSSWIIDSPWGITPTASRLHLSLTFSALYYSP